MKVEVAVLGSPSLIVLMVSVDVKQYFEEEEKEKKQREKRTNKQTKTTHSF